MRRAAREGRRGQRCAPVLTWASAEGGERGVGGSHLAHRLLQPVRGGGEHVLADELAAAIARGLPKLPRRLPSPPVDSHELHHALHTFRQELLRRRNVVVIEVRRPEQRHASILSRWRAERKVLVQRLASEAWTVDGGRTAPIANRGSPRPRHRNPLGLRREGAAVEGLVQPPEEVCTIAPHHRRIEGAVQGWRGEPWGLGGRDCGILVCSRFGSPVGGVARVVDGGLRRRGGSRLEVPAWRRVGGIVGTLRVVDAEGRAHGLAQLRLLNGRGGRGGS